MAPRKSKVTKEKKNKNPVVQQTTTSKETPFARFGIRQLPPTTELNLMMGFELDDDSVFSEEPTMQPNFSFLPSDKHSSPNKERRNKTPTVHGLASMPTVSNSDMTQTDTTIEPFSSASNIQTKSKPPKATPSRPSSSQPISKNVQQNKHSRKQNTPIKDRNVLKDIIDLRNSVHLLIPKLSFGKVIREILGEYSAGNLRVTLEMLVCLQECAELYIVQLLEDAYRCTVHRGRTTLLPKDIQLTLMIRGDQ